MQTNENALFDYLEGDSTLIALLGKPAKECILAMRPQIPEVYPSIIFDTVAAPLASSSSPVNDATLTIDVAARTREEVNVIAARVVDQLHVVQCRRSDQRAFIVDGRRVMYYGFVDTEGQNSYEPTPRDIYHKVLSFRLITTSK